MITWLWLALVALFALGIGNMTRQLHRQGFSWAGIVADHRMRRRP